MFVIDPAPYQPRVAQAQASAAAEELSQLQNAGAHKIVFAYDALQTSLAAVAAASELVAASKLTAAATIAFASGALTNRDTLGAR